MTGTIHIATVHYEDDRWVDVQLDYLRRHISSPMRVYAGLTRLPEDHTGKFFYSLTENIGSHRVKLNLLADLISFAADDPDDILLFIDGDAVPIAPVDGFLEEHLERFPLVAVQRLENGETLPHPCFCAMRVGFWQEIGGNWHHDPAAPKLNRLSEPSPDGGNVLRALEDRQAEWHPLIRSNRRELHPLFYGIYGDLVYHHGGGFRPSVGGPTALAQAVEEKGIESSLVTRVLDAMPKSKVRRKLRRRYHPRHRLKRELRDEVQRTSDDMFERLKTDPHFYRELLGGEEPRVDAPPKAAVLG